MKTSIETLCNHLISEFEVIPSERKVFLDALAHRISHSLHTLSVAKLVFVCTHNSRRSHLGQIWAAVASNYYSVTPIESYSAGTETTAFHPHAIQALQAQGFTVIPQDESNNPTYKVLYDENEAVQCFSKTILDQSLPQANFIAVMTCSDAEENCPFIPGALERIPLKYEDPKRYDETPLQLEKYKERSEQIGRELLYVFSKIN